MPKGVYDRSQSRWRPPPVKSYPELVEPVRRLYESGMTIAEVADELGIGTGKVRRVMTRHGIPARPAGQADRTGENNPNWRGSKAGYQQLHQRVKNERGTPQLCEWCGEDSPDVIYQWANITGEYEDVMDYVRLCPPCHYPYDNARRRLTGERTMPPVRGR